MLQRLHEKAKAAITEEFPSPESHSHSGSTEAESSASKHSSHSPTSNTQDENEDGDELIILRGTTRRINSPNPVLSLPQAISSLSRESQQIPSSSSTAQSYTPTAQYPSGLGSASRDPQRAREWMAAVERDRAAVFASQVAEQQKQNQAFSGQPQPGWMDSAAASSGTYNLDPSTHMDFSAFSGTNAKDAHGAAENGLHPFVPLDFTLDPPSIIPGPFERYHSTSQNAIDFNGGLLGEDTASTVAWHSFMQEFDLTRDVSMNFEDWEVMSSFA